MGAKKKAFEKPSKKNDPLPRLKKICLALPDVTAEPAYEHTKFLVKKKTLAYYTVNHHGDGMLALLVKAAPGVQGTLVEGDPETFFVPPYIGKQGWVGMRLDHRKPDWSAVEALVEDSFLLVAPKRSIAALESAKRVSRRGGGPRARPRATRSRARHSSRGAART